MIKLFAHSKEHCATLLDSQVTEFAHKTLLEPGTYSIQIDQLSSSIRYEGTRLETCEVFLWLLGGRHRDRATGVFTHSRMKCLSGDETFVFDVSERTELYCFWLSDRSDDLQGSTKLRLFSEDGYEEITVPAPGMVVPLPSSVMTEIRQNGASIELQPGEYKLSIDCGEYSFFPERRDAEPIVILFAEGLDKSSKSRKWQTLNGYSDTEYLTFDEHTILRAFWFDSNGADNSGWLSLRIDPCVEKKTKPRLLFIDGQHEHYTWKELSFHLLLRLRETDLFNIDHYRLVPFEVPSFGHIDFSDYDAVVMNYSSQTRGPAHETRTWPPSIRASFEEYVAKGGGLVVVHSTDNSFPLWKEFNSMIGLGGWYGRDEHSGPYAYIDDSGVEQRDYTPGPGGDHPSEKKPFLVSIRAKDHPVFRDMPCEWMHSADELYQKLRGPAENMEILATAFSDPKVFPAGPTTQRHEPMAMTIRYGKGRVFHTTLGHSDPDMGMVSVECVGFIVLLQRAAEWAATGKVTQEIPKDFPTAVDISTRPLQLNLSSLQRKV